MNLNGIMIGSENAQALADYYTQIFGKPEWEENNFTGWLIGSGYVTVGPHDKIKGKSASPGRVIWNIETPDVKAKFEEFKSAGAKVVQEPYQPRDGGEMWIATFADPDDNYFQLMSPMG